jgi:hypothetical protein
VRRWRKEDKAIRSAPVPDSHPLRTTITASNGFAQHTCSESPFKLREREHFTNNQSLLKFCLKVQKNGQNVATHHDSDVVIDTAYTFFKRVARDRIQTVDRNFISEYQM